MSSLKSQNLQVLIVDDEPVIVDLLRDLLEDEGYTVLTANNGTVALYTIQRTSVALVLTDFMMPFVSGIDLARNVRANTNTSSIPVLLMSAAVPRDTHDLFDAVIHKPFSLDEIIRTVRQFLPA